MTSPDPKGQIRDPNTLTAQYLENSWRCYLATITNYCTVCCETGDSTIGYPSDSLASCLTLNINISKTLEDTFKGTIKN